ncbi:MAG TPA: hypothetical protein H9751_12155 [Candidatus Corynebacterium faecigallinarum]|uniref:Cell division protein FtsL n=1 Tax=Candidatus Corynebacterium faecigallinarum TaxID=2838528 RepID=A0A9D2TRN8_9CORY|nr:hypothetical protein [Candidatus Corynebacterium faecigallinarum]
MSTTTATPSRQRRSTAQPERRSSRSTDTVATTTTRRRAHSSPVRRRGSQQQLTVRGRRVAVREPRNRTMMWTVVLMLALLVAGTALAMYLSGRSTEQSFQLNQAQATSDTLSHEIESLNRDVEDVSSTQHIAAEAARLGMEVPGQTGVLNVENGTVDEARPADNSGNRPLTDIDGDVRTVGPSSNTEATSGEGERSSEEDMAAADAAAAAAADASPRQSGDLPYTP